jgi:hypothetical protein
MLPNVRLLIAAMLASVMVLICGFAIFAAFRVSREPIAHLPVAVAPLQMVAENRVAASAVLVTNQLVTNQTVEPSAFELPVGVPEATPAGTAEQQDHAELVSESEQTASEQTAAPQSVAAMDAEASTAPEPEKPTAAMAATEQAPTPAPPVSELPAPSQQDWDRSADIEADAPSAPSPLRPHQPATSTAKTATEATASGAALAFADETPAGAAVADGQPAVAEAPQPKAIAAPDPETKPAAVAGLAVDAMPDHALDRSEADTLPEPPLPRARPNVSDAPHISHAQRAGNAQAARAADERARAAAAVRPRRARVVARTVRAVRFASPYYYAQAQYAQSIDQSYAYGQSNFQGAQVGQEQIVVRRVVRPRPAARVAVRKTTPAVGGPFVSARSP